MENLIKIKYPVDSIRISETGNKLVYKEITISENDKAKYENYCKRIESLFDDPNLNSINIKIKELILLSKKDIEILNFISNNQWILKFVNKNDIELLKQNTNFNISKIKILYPYSAYKDKKNQKVFSKEIYVPVWEKKKIQYQADLITWLVTDSFNSIEDRLKALFLGNSLVGQNIILNNEWILMLINEDYRLELMDKYGISYKSFNRSYGYTTSKKLAKRNIIIPTSLEYKYNLMEEELANIMTIDSNDIYEYLEKYAKEHLDDNYLLRENLWLLNLIKLSEQVEILKILDIKLNLPSKKVVTLRPIDNDRLESYEVDIKLYQYEEYLRLNDQIINLLAMDKIDEDSVINFINSSKLVLEVWPWLNDYVNQDKLKKGKH